MGNFSIDILHSGKHATALIPHTFIPSRIHLIKRVRASKYIDLQNLTHQDLAIETRLSLSTKLNTLKMH